MFHSKVELVFSTNQELLDIINKYSVRTPEGGAILRGPSLIPGDRVKWHSSRYGWTEGVIQELRARRPRPTYKKVDGAWTAVYPTEEYVEQAVIVGEYTRNGYMHKSTIVMHPSNLIKVNKGQSAQ